MTTSTPPSQPPMPLIRLRRRRLLSLVSWPFLPGWLGLLAASRLQAAVPGPGRARVRPGDAGWPDDAQWKQLDTAVGGALIALHSPLSDCMTAPSDARCQQVFATLRNPYAIGDDPALTQTLGWVDAWTSAPSAHAVAARRTADVVAAVDFARRHDLRLVVKGGGHSYQGTSSAPDSLLIWTRHMRRVTLHDAFTADGCTGPAQRAVTVEAGALWSQVYDAVTTRGGDYVQGGGCMTVGVAGLVQSGGFGSFSKAFGLASASLLQAEVVTADGQVRTCNACTNPDLFWGLKGGGGGSLGVVTRLTLKVHALPETFGAVNFSIQATSPAAFRRLIGLVLDFCSRSLVGAHWGEQIRIRRDDSVQFAMVFQDMTRSEAQAVWQPFLDLIEASPKDFSIPFSPLKIVSTPARTFWSPTLVKRVLGFIRRDDRPDAPDTNVFWPGDEGQAGQVMHGYGSAWLPAGLLEPDRRPSLGDALFAASRHWVVSLHLNKGLAGAPPEAIAAARDTAMNPAVLDAFALAICATAQAPAYPGVAGHEPDAALARQRAQAIRRAMDALHALAPTGAPFGSYVSESDYFLRDWQRAFWGANYPRLLSVKHRYDPEGLFFVHHGVGSEAWSADGFVRTG